MLRASRVFTHLPIAVAQLPRPLSSKRLPVITMQAETSGHPPCVHLDPDFSPPTEIFTSSDDVHVELLRIQPAPSPDLHSEVLHTHLILLPGNPGVVEYYRPFLRSLADALSLPSRPHVSIHALGLPGHDLRSLNGSATYAIDEHMSTVTSYIAALPPGRLVLLGHSYGSYLALRVLAALEHHQEQPLRPDPALVMLMPCVWQMAQCAGLTLRTAMSNPLGLVTWGTWLLTTMVPTAVTDALVNRVGHAPGVRVVSRRIVNGRQRGLYENVLSLAQDEMVTIREPGDLDGRRLVGGRALFVFAEDDFWCPDLARDEIMKEFGTEVELINAGVGVEHAFVLSEKQTERVARVTANWLKRTVLGDSSNFTLC